MDDALPFRGSLAVASGELTRGRLRGPAFRRVGPDTFVAATAPDDLRTAVRAVRVRYPDAVLVGTTAAVLWGAVDDADRGRPGLGGHDPVEIGHAGADAPAWFARFRADRLDAGEIVELDGVRLSSPLRTAFDVARRLATVDAVSALEALGRDRRVDLGDVRRLAEEHPQERGLVRLRAACDLVEPWSGSAFATRVRLALMRAGIRRPAVRPVITDAAGSLLGAPDLAWIEERVGILCGPGPRPSARGAAGLAEAGWTVQVLDRGRWCAEPDRVVEDVGHVLRRSRRRWALDRAADLRWSPPRRRPPEPVLLFEAASEVR